MSEEDADRDERSRRRVNICKCRTSRCLWGDVGTFSAEFVETEPGSCSPNTNQVVCVPEQTKVRAQVWTFVKKHTYIHTYVGRSLQLNSQRAASEAAGCHWVHSTCYFIKFSGGADSWSWDQQLTKQSLSVTDLFVSQFFLSTAVSENEASNSREFGFSLI